MRNIAICSRGLINTPYTLPNIDKIDVIEIEKQTVGCCLIRTKESGLDPHNPDHQQMVLVKTKAFSCNYRDKSIILDIANHAKPAFYAVGSEFVGDVVAVGSHVNHLKAGDHVISNGCYPSETEGVVGGLPTNKGSKEYQLIHQAKLLKVSPDMPVEVAAAFSIGAQTSYSMVQKLALKPGANVLVTAAKSNTTLFTINALKKYDVNIYATTTSMQHADLLRQKGVTQLMKLDTTQTALAENEPLKKVAAEIGGFDAVVDPFYDVHLEKIIEVMKMGARYVTCGNLYQHYYRLLDEVDYKELHWHKIMIHVMQKNLHLIGNCLGQTTDLQQAVIDYDQGLLEVCIDSVYSGHEVGAFFDRTYNEPTRFGKVVYQYD